MTIYAAKRVEEDGITVIELSDALHEAQASVVPEIGNNLYRFVSQGHPVILSPVRLQAFRQDPFVPFQYGTPILYPPNRVKNGTFEFQGRTYQLPLNEPTNHLHGELCSRAWEVTDCGASDDQGAYVTSCFRYRDHPEMVAYFPHALVFRVTYRLFEGALSMETSIANEGDDEAPFAFGLHPYFPIDPDDGGEILLQVPAAREWPVTNEAFVQGEPEITEFSRRLQSGVDLREYPVLGCSLIEAAGDDTTCRIQMTQRNYTIAYRFDRHFPFVVLFRPDWASAFSLEPYTCVTDAFNLPYGYELTGAQGIRPGEVKELKTSLWIEAGT